MKWTELVLSAAGLWQHGDSMVGCRDGMTTGWGHVGNGTTPVRLTGGSTGVFGTLVTRVLAKATVLMVGRDGASVVCLMLYTRMILAKLCHCAKKTRGTGMGQGVTAEMFMPMSKATLLARRKT